MVLEHWKRNGATDRRCSLAAERATERDGDAHAIVGISTVECQCLASGSSSGIDCGRGQYGRAGRRHGEPTAGRIVVEYRAVDLTASRSGTADCFDHGPAFGKSRRGRGCDRAPAITTAVTQSGIRVRRVSRCAAGLKRPKGRWFVGSCLATAVSLRGLLAMEWNSGTSGARRRGMRDIVQLAAPAAARVASVHAREGQEVRMGDLLVTLDGPELLQQIDRTRDELRVALATVAAETIRASREDESGVWHVSEGSLADYFRFRTQLIEAETSWQERSDELARQRGLVARGAAAAADVDRLSTQMSGLQETIDQLREAIDGLQPEQSPVGQQPAVDPMVGPQLADVDELCRELGRLREQLSLCELRAPCDGLVVRQHHYAGETVAAGRTDRRVGRARIRNTSRCTCRSVWQRSCRSVPK